MTSLFVLALACNCGGGTDDTAPPTVTDDSGTVDSADSGHTTDTVETGETAETGDTATDTGDTGPITPGSLAVAPRQIIVDPGAEWGLRAIWRQDGEHNADVTVTWSSSDESLVTLTAEGRATAHAPGEVTLTATWGGLEAVAAVTVQEVPVLRVQLVAAEDGSPITTGKIRYDGTTDVVDEVTGIGELTVPAGEAIWFTAWSADGDRIPTTVMSLVGRDLVLPLRAAGSAVDPDGGVAGTFDFGGVPPLSDDEKAAGYILLGLAAPSLRYGPLFWRPEDLLAPDRDVNIYGIDARLPANITLDDEVEDWATPAWSGPGAVWSFAGPVPLADAAFGLSDLSSALDLLLESIDAFTYGFEDGLAVPAGGVLEQDVRPSTSLSEVVEVELPAWPDGVDSTETALLLAVDGDGPAGPGVAGFGRGFPGTAHTSRAPGSYFGWDGSAAQILAYLEDGGAGIGGARMLSVAPIVDGFAVLPEFPQPPRLEDFDAKTHEVQVHADPDAELVHLYIESKDGAERDYYLPVVSELVWIPGEGPSFGWANTRWEMTVVRTDEGTFESLVIEGTLMRSDLADRAVTTSFVTEKFGGDR